MITTERLVLRQHRPDDLDVAAALFADSVAMRFIGGATLSHEDVWHRLLSYAGHWQWFGFGLRAVEERASGRMVVELGFADFHRGLGDGFDGYPEAAWICAVSAQGRGLATEAMAEALAWLDRHHPAASSVHDRARERASLRLAERLGYVSLAASPYRDRPIRLLRRSRPAASQDEVAAAGPCLSAAPSWRCLARHVACAWTGGVVIEPREVDPRISGGTGDRQGENGLDRGDTPGKYAAGLKRLARAQPRGPE